MERAALTSELETAGVAARALVAALAVWCLAWTVSSPVRCALRLRELAPEHHVDVLAIELSWAFAAALAGAAVLTRGHRLVRWRAMHAFPVLGISDRTPLVPGSGWLAFGLPVFALYLGVNALLTTASALALTWRDGIRPVVFEALPSLGFAVCAFLAAPSIARAWARWNAPRTLS